MKILSNGFNLYEQLAETEHLLEKFTPIFGGYSLQDVCISHSFSVLKIDENYRIIYKNQEIGTDCGKVVKVCANDERIVLLNDRGKLFRIDLTDIAIPYEIPNTLNSELPDEQIVDVNCGSKLTIAYSNKGNIFSIPLKLNFKNENIIDMKCGREHCILLDKSGNIYTFGRGSRGQLGHGNLDDESEPVEVKALGGIKIVQIAAGGWHSCAISEEGDLYTWGWNGNGQLGLGQGKDEEPSVAVMASPHVVDFPDEQRNAVHVACGSRHSIVLLDNNHLYGCGWNKYKQLLSSEKENYHIFTYLYDLSNEEVISLKCGPWNSVVLCR